jgi:hypothetical protein
MFLIHVATKLVYQNVGYEQVLQTKRYSGPCMSKSMKNNPQVMHHDRHLGIFKDLSDFLQKEIFGARELFASS